MSDHPVQSDCRNILLRTMSAADFASLSPHLHRFELSKGSLIVATDGAIEHVHFVEDGIASIVATSPEGQACEAGLFGFDGFGPVSPVLGSDRSPHRIIMQVAGHSLWIEAARLTAAADASASLRHLLLRYVHTLMVQMGFTALSNVVHIVDERLARWLLMCHDRSPSDDILLTHELMALMLAVRRPSVTTSLQMLEGHRYIRAERGCVTIRNRAALQEFARDAYGKAEEVYRQSIAPLKS